MARNEIFVDASPNDVFDVLSDAARYASWVVGAREIRAADPSWPAPGAALAHKVGRPPLAVADETVVLHARRPVRLELCARARPLPSARVTLDLQPERDGTRVTMVEDIASAPLNALAGPLIHAAIRARNRESLRRLKALAEQPGAHAVSAPPLAIGSV